MTALAARHLYEFNDHILVECPVCHGRAIIIRTAPAITEKNRSRDMRFSCLVCSHSRLPAYPYVGDLCSLTAGLRLWLETDMRQGRFFALNYEHLDYIETYVNARLRTVGPHSLGVRNGLVTSRLPAWIKSAKNRDKVLKTIASLRRK